MIKPASRATAIAPFHVMEILARARQLEATGRNIVHMEIGEPDFVSPEPIIDAGRRALRQGATHYTPASGLPALRDAVAEYYAEHFAIAVDPARILITPGASGALQLVLSALLDPGDRVAVTDPGYPCNRHMISLLGGEPVAIPVDSVDDYAVTDDSLAIAMRGGLRSLMLASPANPTGNVIGLEQLATLHRQLCKDADSVLVCDEIYQGLQYEIAPATALSLDTDRLVVINSFSKFFGMTGWRVGWTVAPEWMIEPMERIAQNIFLAAPTPAQHAALAAFDVRTLGILEQRRQAFAERRDFLYQAATELGFGLGKPPGGAFYLYADAVDFTDNSKEFCRLLLEHAGVAITPGADFGAHLAARHIRLAYTTDLSTLAEGVERIRTFLRAGS